MDLDEAFESSQQSFESLTLDSGNGNGKHRLSSNFDELSDLTQPNLADDDEVSRYNTNVTHFHSTAHLIHFPWRFFFLFSDCFSFCVWRS